MKLHSPTVLIRSLSDQRDSSNFSAVISIIENGSFVVKDTKVICNKETKVALSDLVPSKYLPLVFQEAMKQLIQD